MAGQPGTKQPGADRKPAAWQSPKNIRSLSFQGGGGKGITYLGALDWLEGKGAPLPLVKNRDGSTGPLVLTPGLQGVAGASAGAITALMVALGYSAAQLKQIFGAVQVQDLIDPPEFGRVRWVSRKGSVLDLAGPGSVAAATLLPTLFGGKPAVVAIEALLALKANTSLLRNFFSNPLYLECLLADGGFASGIQIRSWLGQQIANSPLMAMTLANAPPAAKAQIPQDGTKVSFGQLHRMLRCQVQLAVTTTNLSTGRPVVFSPSSTPDFPVADAVSISASFPGVFKPAWIGFDAPLGYAPAARNLNVMSNFVGWYADGGMINNVPLHAFDAPVVPIDPYLIPTQGQSRIPSLNEYMLSLRLQQGDPPGPINALPQDPPNQTPGLASVLGGAFDALNFQANAGQIRSPAEGKQTVLLYTGKNLGLLDFISPPGPREQAWANASAAMQTYYTEPPRVPPVK